MVVFSGSLCQGAQRLSSSNSNNLDKPNLPKVKAKAKAKFGDAYQRVQRFTQGDVIALPSGVAHWFYNDGDVPIVAVYVFDINSNANQLEPKQKVTVDERYIFVFNHFRCKIVSSIFNGCRDAQIFT